MSFAMDLTNPSATALDAAGLPKAALDAFFNILLVVPSKIASAVPEIPAFNKYPIPRLPPVSFSSSSLFPAAAATPNKGKLTAPIAIFGIDSTVVFNPSYNIFSIDSVLGFCLNLSNSSIIFTSSCLVFLYISSDFLFKN